LTFSIGFLNDSLSICIISCYFVCSCFPPMSWDDWYLC